MTLAKHHKQMRTFKFRFWNPVDKVMSNNHTDASIWHGLLICEGDTIPMQFTGLKDKNGIGNICIYEGDIISLDGELVGNKYENADLLKDETNLLIEGIGTKGWRSTEKRAMARGFWYSE